MNITVPYIDETINNPQALGMQDCLNQIRTKTDMFMFLLPIFLFCSYIFIGYLMPKRVGYLLPKKKTVVLYVLWNIYQAANVFLFLWSITILQHKL